MTVISGLPVETSLPLSPNDGDSIFYSVAGDYVTYNAFNSVWLTNSVIKQEFRLPVSGTPAIIVASTTVDNIRMNNSLIYFPFDLYLTKGTLNIHPSFNIPAGLRVDIRYDLVSQFDIDFVGGTATEDYTPANPILVPSDTSFHPFLSIIGTPSGAVPDHGVLNFYFKRAFV